MPFPSIAKIGGILAIKISMTLKNVFLNKDRMPIPFF